MASLVLLWIRNVLSQRNQQSSTGRVTSGVPQGSVLGPTLFLTYINNQGHNIKSRVRLFADVTILYNKITTRVDSQPLQGYLEALED